MAFGTLIAIVTSMLLALAFVLIIIRLRTQQNNIPYIMVLKYAAQQAIGVGIKGHSNNNNRGFTFEEIKKDRNCIAIDEKWLREILPCICTLWKDDKELKENDAQNVAPENLDEYQFVISSNEYVKYVTLKTARTTKSSLIIAVVAICITIVAQFAVIIYPEEIKSFGQQYVGNSTNVESPKHDDC